MKLFISYAYNDELYVSRLADSLRKEGLNVWLDKEQIRPGEERNKALAKGLRQSDLMLAVVKPRTNPATFNRNVYFEAGMAMAMGKPVRFIIPEAEIKSGRLPFGVDKALIRGTPAATARKLIQSEHLSVKVGAQRASRSGIPQPRATSNR